MEKEEVKALIQAEVKEWFGAFESYHQDKLAEIERKLTLNVTNLSQTCAKDISELVQSVNNQVAQLRTAIYNESVNNSNLRTAMGHLQGMFYKLPLEFGDVNYGDA